jgi:TonB-dependent SusC/RagA subfamily outer membrane receptor
VLVVSYVNYITQEVAPKSDATINITLEPDDGKLGEVVVIGYGTVKKSDVTGSVVSLKAKDLNPGANLNVEQSLLGRAAGVQVYQKSGEPGSAMSVKIRGASSITAGNDPLYVVDGMPVNNLTPVAGSSAGFVATPNPRNPLNSLNPADIESIEILKDASATAIYGSRGSNGVVIITTKKGASGRLKVGYNAYYGSQTCSTDNNIKKC